MKRPLHLERQDNPESVSASRAGLIARVWQVVEFVENIRADLRTSPQKDPIAIALTTATQQLILAAGMMGPKTAQPPAPRVERVAGEGDLVPSIRVKERRSVGA